MEIRRQPVSARVSAIRTFGDGDPGCGARGEFAAGLVCHPALGLCGKGKFPTSGTFGKHLQGRKRGAHAALQVLALAGQRLRLVLRQEAVVEGDKLEAALRLLETVDLEGKIISADAGIFKAPMAQAVVQKGAVTSA